MFRSRRRYGGRGGGGGIGLVLLGLQLVNLYNFISRSNEFYPVTLGVLALNIVAYLQPGTVAWPTLRQACISVQGVWFQKQWKKIFLAPFFHSSDLHLYYNMASFMWKAISLEHHFGTPYFLYMISVFSVGTSTVYLGINYMLAELLDQWSYVQSCAVGFSGVLFALKVVTTHMQPRGVTMVMGVIPVPMRLACWVELVLISVLFPNVSFVGHLAGILVGLAFVSGPLKTAMDIPLSLGSGYPGVPGQPGGRPSYTYRADPSGYRNRGQGPPASASTDNTEEQELQDAIHQSLADDTTHTRAPTHRHNEDRDLQSAIDRSLADSDDTLPPSNSDDTHHVPPYNPDFHTDSSHRTDIHDSETVISGNASNDDHRTLLRRRPVARGNVDMPNSSQSEHQNSSDSLSDVRAARLRRFGQKS